MPIDMMHPYGQLLSRMSRRQLLDIAWKLGAVAALPMTTRAAWAQPIFRTYPFSLGVASGDPWPTSVVLWTRLAPEPFEGGGMPTANVEVSWQVATDRSIPHRRSIGNRDGAAGARSQRPCRGRWPRTRPRVLLSLPLRRRSQPDRTDQDRAGGRHAGRSAALRRLRLRPLRDRLLLRLRPPRR